MPVQIVKNSRGFTTVELLITLVFITVIFSLVTVNLSGLIPKANLDQSVSSFISDLRRQQLKAMLGDIENVANTSAYGAYLGSNDYTLFKGSSYNPADANNILVDLPDNIQLSASDDLPQQTIVFQVLDGEVSLNGTSSAEILVTDTIQQQSKVITVNALGVLYVEPE